MKTAISLAILAALCTALPATVSLANDDSQETMVWDGMPLKRSCDKNTITINECAHAVWKTADDELNALYREQLSYLHDTEAKYPPGRGASKRLVAAQKAWLVFRDKDCEYRLGEPGGSGDTFETLKCMYKHSLKRSAELREYIACRYNGCPF